jgi:hypothetical protein
VVANRHHHHAGEALRRQAKLVVQHGGVETFDRYRVQTQRRNAQQEVTQGNRIKLRFATLFARKPA